MINLLFALFYVLAGKLSFYFALENSIVTIAIFFPEGIALALVLIYGKKVIPGIFIGQLILALSTDVSFLPAMCIAIINSLEALLALYISKKIHFDKKLLTLKDIYLLFFMIIFILQPFSAMGGVLTLTYFSSLTSTFTQSLFSWWFGNVMGQLLLVPMILILYENRDNINIKDIILVMISFSLINYFLIIILQIDNIALLFSIMIPSIMLVVRYIGLQYAGIAVLVITISSLSMSRMGIGIFTTDTVTNNLININFYILAHLAIVYIHGTLIIEKESLVGKLAILNQELEKRVQVEVKKNREKERLMMYQSRLAQMGEMIALVAHQWKQPLNTLSMITSGIYRDHSMHKLTEEKMETFHKSSQRQIQGMSETIDTFRNFFKPEKKVKEYKLTESIDYILTILSPVFEEKSIEVIVNIEENIMLKGYQNEFDQVLLNIMNNAKDAFSEQHNNKTIWITAKEIDSKVSIIIEDNAGGIDEAIISQIFNLYFSTKNELNGTGLGLYISKIIIEKNMQGSIAVKNTTEGAVFSIII